MKALPDYNSTQSAYQQSGQDYSWMQQPFASLVSRPLPPSYLFQCPALGPDELVDEYYDNRGNRGHGHHPAEGVGPHGVAVLSVLGRLILHKTEDEDKLKQEETIVVIYSQSQNRLIRMSM